MDLELMLRFIKRLKFGAQVPTLADIDFRFDGNVEMKERVIYSFVEALKITTHNLEILRIYGCGDSMVACVVSALCEMKYPLRTLIINVCHIGNASTTSIDRFLKSANIPIDTFDMSYNTFAISHNTFENEFSVINSLMYMRRSLKCISISFNVTNDNVIKKIFDVLCLMKHPPEKFYIDCNNIMDGYGQAYIAKALTSTSLRLHTLTISYSCNTDFDGGLGLIFKSLKSSSCRLMNIRFNHRFNNVYTINNCDFVCMLVDTMRHSKCDIDYECYGGILSNTMTPTIYYKMSSIIAKNKKIFNMSLVV